ncbi:outer membrane beta-barrel protein [Flavobacterium sp. A45]|uniref:outer membrane beta-barrel protein n=1 Tax=Flavobacterium sp. A45 TaxID=1945862 RepID=UPI000F515638|nr:outer membrane beta-barrel protein [Flavobacterium sp. A45]
MKTTLKIKLLSAFTIALLFANNSQAQDTKSFDKGFRLGIGLNGGIPTDNNDYDWSLGGDVRLQYDLAPRASLTLTTGFTNLFVDPNVKDLGFIPVKAGFKAFIGGNQFYLLGEVGGGFAVTNGHDQNTYIWSPGVGYATKNIDVSLRYEAYTDYDTDQIALRVAYGFDL